MGYCKPFINTGVSIYTLKQKLLRLLSTDPSVIMFGIGLVVTVIVSIICSSGDLEALAKRGFGPVPYDK